MATTRLRRTFHYPSDSDDPPDLDEEHQETLLQDLESSDEKTSTLYRNLFLALPITALLNAILNPNTTTRGTTATATETATSLFLTLLQITVPALAAWILYFHPITTPGTQGLRSLYSSSGSQPGSNNKKPTSRHLILLGVSLSGILVITAAGKWSSLSTSASPEVTAAVRRINGEWGEIGNVILPAGMLLIFIFILIIFSFRPKRRQY